MRPFALAAAATGFIALGWGAGYETRKLTHKDPTEIDILRKRYGSQMINDAIALQAADRQAGYQVSLLQCIDNLELQQYHEEAGLVHESVAERASTKKNKSPSSFFS